MTGWIGKTLGQVRIEKLLARGGVAEVYLGTHVALQRQVAVKILRMQYQDNPNLLERFEREARAVARLRHPNIVQVYDFNVIDGQPYLVMEYFPGGSLSDHLATLQGIHRQLEIAAVNQLVVALAGALQYAHESGVIHRDVKPANVLMTSPSSLMTAGELLPPDAEPVLTDFGLVRFLNSPEHTAAGQIGGTPAYMSPEQARGAATDGRTDIYSLGIVIYEMLAGRVPYEAETPVGLLLKHINEPPPPISKLPSAIQRVLDRAMAKDPADRFDTPVKFAEAFSSVAEGNAETITYPLPTLMPAAALEVDRRTPAYRRAWLPAVAGLVVLAVGWFLWLKGAPLFPSSPASPSETSAFVEPPLANPTGAPAGLPEGPVGVLRFQDGAAFADKVTLTTLSMSDAPARSQYEVWLTAGDDRRSLGLLTLDPQGAGKLSYVDSQSRNLLAFYDSVEITVEPDPETDPIRFGRVAYSFSLPTDGLVHLRRLLVADTDAPNDTALIQGLDAQTNLILQGAQAMLRDYQLGNEAAARKSAETILNALVGVNSPDYEDWDGDGEITSSGDGYGLMTNGEQAGYIQAVISEAEAAAATADATQEMIVHGEHVQICASDLQEWAPELADLMRNILASDSGAEMERSIRAAVTLAYQMLNGTDLDGDEKIEPIAGEGGVRTAYEHAYYMADMTIFASESAGTGGADVGTPLPTVTGTAATTTAGPTAGSTPLPTGITLPTDLPTSISIPTVLDLPTSIPLPQILPTENLLSPILNTPILTLP